MFVDYGETGSGFWNRETEEQEQSILVVEIRLGSHNVDGLCLRYTPEPIGSHWKRKVYV